MSSQAFGGAPARAFDAASARALGVASAAELGQFLDRLAREGRVVGVDIGTPFVDVGTPEALAAVGGVAR